MPSNCSGAQAAATAAIVKYKPKIGQISSILSEYSNFYWKTKNKDVWRRVSFTEFHLTDHWMEHYLCEYTAAGDLCT